MIRIKITAFTDLNISEFGTKAQEIVNHMNNNPNFPTPTPALADVQVAIDAYDLLVSEASGGDRDAINDRNQQRSIVAQLLIQLAAYVAFTVRNAVNAKLLIESAGFEVAKTSSHIGELVAPSNLQSSVIGEPGGVQLKWNAVRGAYSYVVEITQGSGPSAMWDEFATVTKTKFKALGLTPGQFYSFRVRAVGAAGYSEPSDVTTSVVG